MTKVIHVHLIFKKRDYYFGSTTAIYDHLTEEDVGIEKTTLLHRIAASTPVVTQRAIIKQGQLLRRKVGFNRINKV